MGTRLMLLLSSFCEFLAAIRTLAYGSNVAIVTVNHYAIIEMILSHW